MIISRERLKKFGEIPAPEPLRSPRISHEIIRGSVLRSQGLNAWDKDGPDFITILNYVQTILNVHTSASLPVPSTTLGV
jgi:hypothetical protein